MIHPETGTDANVQLVDNISEPSISHDLTCSRARPWRNCGLPLLGTIIRTGNMRNLRNIRFTLWKPPKIVTASCWDASNDDVVLASGPSTESSEIELFRISEPGDGYVTCHHCFFFIMLLFSCRNCQLARPASVYINLVCSFNAAQGPQPW